MNTDLTDCWRLFHGCQTFYSRLWRFEFATYGSDTSLYIIILAALILSLFLTDVLKISHEDESSTYILYYFFYRIYPQTTKAYYLTLRRRVFFFIA